MTAARMYEDCVLQSMRFPQKLWRIVNECETGAIRWGANGNTILLDYNRFQAEYLDARRPIFKTSNITSFIRQLNLYGFRKVTCHGRDPVCTSCNPHVHEFLHENFRADRMDLLAEVCRKSGGGKGRCTQHEKEAKGAEENSRSEENPRPEEKSRSEENHLSRLKLCQLALTKTLEQIIQEYRREHEEEKTLITTKNNALKRIRNTQEDTVPVLYEIEFSNVPNRKLTIERNVKYSPFVPIKTDTSSERKMISLPWRSATMDKRSSHLNVQNTQ